MTDDPIVAPSGLATVPADMLARRLERQRAAGQTTLLPECGPADRARVLAWCEDAECYPELVAQLAALED
jgi:hypothetical protein